MSGKLEKKIGIGNIIGLGVGGAVGAGIFVTLGSAIALTGRSVVPITILCVFYMLLAYWYNLALSSIFIIKGGDYSMRGMLLSPLLTGYGGWTNVIWAFGFTGYSMALTHYLGSLWPVLIEHEMAVSLVILSLHFLLTIRGNRIVTLFQNVATALLVMAMALFIVLGLPEVNFSVFFDPAVDGGFFHGGVAGIISAVAIMGFACQGTTMGPVGVVPIAKDPKRSIPYGIIYTCLVVSVIYGLMSLVASGILPYDQIAGKNLSVVASSFLSHGLFGFFIIGGGVCAIISSFLSVLVMIREPLIQMGNDGWLPGFLKRQNKDHYPYGAYLLVYVLAAIPIITKMDFNNVISMLMIPCMFINAYLNVACIKIPKLYPEQFANRSLPLSLGAYKACCILGGFSAFMVAVTLLKDMQAQDAVVALIVLVVPLALSYLALKTGRVDRAVLLKRRQEIIDEETRGAC
ncbi:APC family permease [Acidaminococcus intestini]|jgi:APA family basic amino acid/polyamine antiporter|uniref:APC family permease n=1 Tax=Acidaminococcus intestini TaxID=187327 RepID=UPI0025E6E9D0|nr:APC family permease [Acidaminococcus intestini]